jgi:GNAT superfamily N-acetyltransferase
MLKIQRATWAEMRAEAEPLFKVHYDELALHKDVMPMGCDHEFYFQLERNNFLLVVTARRDGRLVGYYVGIVIAHHPHNKEGGKVSTTDMFFILPSERRGGAGVKLLRFVEHELRREGVKKATISTKLHFENAELLEALGWEKTDIVRQKVF